MLCAGKYIYYISLLWTSLKTAQLSVGGTFSVMVDYTPVIHLISK